MSLVDTAVRIQRRRRADKARITETDRSTEGSGRTALVTGASSGIGRAMAELLAAKSYDVVVVARRTDRLESLCAELRSTWGIACHVVTADLCDPSAPAAIQGALSREGITVDVLVNNAGHGLFGSYVDHPWEDHARLVQLLGLSVVELCRRLLPDMIEQGWGRIINVTSVAGVMSGTPHQVLYCATKSFVHRFTEGLAVECAKNGVHATVSVPGTTDTEGFQVLGLADWAETSPTFQLTAMSPMTVARQAYAASMRGRKVMVHGLHHKLYAHAASHAPAPIRYAMSSWLSTLEPEPARSG